MSRHAEPPFGFSCPYKHRCPHAENLSVRFLFEEYHRSRERERASEDIELFMREEIRRLEERNRELEIENDKLRAEVRTLQLAPFKKAGQTGGKKGKTRGSQNAAEKSIDAPAKEKKRGAPEGHPAWNRQTPEKIDCIVEVGAPELCPHCEGKTDLSRQEVIRFVQEDIELCPRTVVTEYLHTTAWCPCCRRDVRKNECGILLDAPIGPNTKAVALYFRHVLKMPVRKIEEVMRTLFGIHFVPASVMGFEKKARKNGDKAYSDLMERLRHTECIHADETHWREDGRSAYVFYAGGDEIAVFHIDPSRSGEAAQVLLGSELDAVLITDAYKGYNGIKVRGRQSCLAHLIRKATEVEEEIGRMKKPDAKSVRFCRKLRSLFGLVCRTKVPEKPAGRQELESRLLRTLDLLCESPLKHEKAETLRKRFLLGARERDEVFTCIRHGTPPTNNQAERTLRPLVIFRKVCMGTRSRTGSENVAVFNSLLETTRRQNGDPLNLLLQLFVGELKDVHAAIFPQAEHVNTS